MLWLSVMHLCEEHTYVCRFAVGDHAAALLALGRWAQDPNLNFSWQDAALMTQRVLAWADAPARSPSSTG